VSGPYLRLFVGDYLRDTRGLSAEQHGAYLLLLMSMWTADGYLPNHPAKLARFAGCTPTRWGRISSEIMPFFEVVGDQITSLRILTEIENAAEIALKNSDNGKKGAKAKALKRLAAAKATASQTGHIQQAKPKHSNTTTEEGVLTHSPSSVGGPPSDDRPDGSSSAARGKPTPAQAARAALVKATDVDWVCRFYDGNPVTGGVLFPTNDIARAKLAQHADLLAEHGIIIHSEAVSA
jgi:uncharacterized protein YdaU (DUF1376 family)